MSTCYFDLCVCILYVYSGMGERLCRMPVLNELNQSNQIHVFSLQKICICPLLIFVLSIQRTSSSTSDESAVHCLSILTAHLGEVFTKMIWNARN